MNSIEFYLSILCKLYKFYYILRKLNIFRCGGINFFKEFNSLYYFLYENNFHKHFASNFIGTRIRNNCCIKLKIRNNLMTKDKMRAVVIR